MQGNHNQNPSESDSASSILEDGYGTDSTHPTSIQVDIGSCPAKPVAGQLRHEDTKNDHCPESNVTPALLCDICGNGDPGLCCFMCNNGAPYHEECWAKDRHHSPGRKPIHEKVPIAWLGRLQYFNEPNMQASIEDEKLKQDDENCFIEFNIQNEQEKYHLGQRAFPLLRATDGLDSEAQCPSFISFVGRTGNGKSFLIRALQHEDTADGQPTPIPAPGYEDHNSKSTSGDIHLYADAMTARVDSPILFLDCEGFEGSAVPRGVRTRLDDKTAEERRKHVEVTFPRFIYAFSTCIVFVTSGSRQESTNILERLVSYASDGSSGTKNQGFKPSLFLVFNRFREGRKPDFDWSIESSSNAFTDKDLAKLKIYYSNIQVVYIPDMLLDGRPVIALRQIDAFKMALREEHEKAFQRRQEFHLTFTSMQLHPFLRKALKHFSDKPNKPFDWALEAPPITLGTDEWESTLIDLWTQYLRHHSISTTPSQILYNRVRDDFEKHIIFCLRLRLCRNIPHGRTIEEVLAIWSPQLIQLNEYIPCGAKCPEGFICEKVLFRHGEYHEHLTPRKPCSTMTRWAGPYQRRNYELSRKFEDTFKATLKEFDSRRLADVSLDRLTSGTIPQKIRSVATCIGCLQGPPSTILACGHAFCFDCVRDIMEVPKDHLLPHRCTVIRCPIHQGLPPQRFSPRLLPIQAGYRILSLDGGGVKGIAQLTVLRAIEEKCFQIPVIHLFDLVVGTSIGGQIALALNIPTSSDPLTVTEATNKFRELMENSFELKSFIPFNLISILADRTKYKAKNVERELSAFFGDETKLFSAASDFSQPPNVAVTTVAVTIANELKPYLISNYNRKPSNDATPLLFGTTKTPDDCMLVKAAARCTSAAVPYYKHLEWQNHMLLDGGFKYNCPAACAHAEAKSIWPSKSCDILLSLGTGQGRAKQPTTQRNIDRLANAIAHHIADANETWRAFCNAGKEKEGILRRLNPVYSGTGFDLDQFRKLDEINRQTTQWIATQSKELAVICDQLIAALFFFRPFGGIHIRGARNRNGEILCRLPADLPERENLVDRMLQIQAAGSNLFQVDYGGRVGAQAYVKALQKPTRNAELRIHVILPDLPAGAPGETQLKIHVKMRSLGGGVAWLPISGSPY